MKFSTTDLIALGALSLSLVGNITGILVWFMSSAKKRYAAERDFAYLCRNQEQMGTGINSILDEQRAGFLEIKYILGKDPLQK